jgi:hypothetical protein
MNTVELAREFVPAEVAPTAPRTLTRLLLAGAATVSVASGLLHVAAVPEHWGDYRIAALFFVALGIFQVAWAALLLGRPSRMLYAAGAVVSLGTIATWAVSRTSGLPFGPFAGVAERAGRADIISTLLEEALVVLLILLAFGVGERRRYDTPTYRAGLTGITSVAAVLTVWGLTALHAGAHGGTHVGLLSEMVGHHGLHLVFAGGAVVVYFGYVIAHVRSHGWPSFSWSLTP